eukprot:764091-Hanusia_phi.AAC.6
MLVAVLVVEGLFNSRVTLAVCPASKFCCKMRRTRPPVDHRANPRKRGSCCSSVMLILGDSCRLSPFWRTNETVKLTRSASACEISKENDPLALSHPTTCSSLEERTIGKLPSAVALPVSPEMVTRLPANSEKEVERVAVMRCIGAEGREKLCDHQGSAVACRSVQEGGVDGNRTCHGEEDGGRRLAPAGVDEDEVELIEKKRFDFTQQPERQRSCAAIPRGILLEDGMIGGEDPEARRRARTPRQTGQSQKTSLREGARGGERHGQRVVGALRGCGLFDVLLKETGDHKRCLSSGCGRNVHDWHGDAAGGKNDQGRQLRRERVFQAEGNVIHGVDDSLSGHSKGQSPVVCIPRGCGSELSDLVGRSSVSRIQRADKDRDGGAWSRGPNEAHERQLAVSALGQRNVRAERERQIVVSPSLRRALSQFVDLQASDEERRQAQSRVVDKHLAHDDACSWLDSPRVVLLIETVEAFCGPSVFVTVKLKTRACPRGSPSPKTRAFKVPPSLSQVPRGFKIPAGSKTLNDCEELEDVFLRPLSTRTVPGVSSALACTVTVRMFSSFMDGLLCPMAAAKNFAMRSGESLPPAAASSSGRILGNDVCT